METRKEEICGVVKIKDIEFEYFVLKFDESWYVAGLYNEKELLRFQVSSKTFKSALSLVKLKASNYLSKQKSNIE